MDAILALVINADDSEDEEQQHADDPDWSSGDEDRSDEDRSTASNTSSPTEDSEDESYSGQYWEDSGEALPVEEQLEGDVVPRQRAWIDDGRAEIPVALAGGPTLPSLVPQGIYSLPSFVPQGIYCLPKGSQGPKKPRKKANPALEMKKLRALVRDSHKAAVFNQLAERGRKGWAGKTATTVKTAQWNAEYAQNLAPYLCSCGSSGDCVKPDCVCKGTYCIFCPMCYSWQHVCCAEATHPCGEELGEATAMQPTVDKAMDLGSGAMMQRPHCQICEKPTDHGAAQCRCSCYRWCALCTAASEARAHGDDL
jgi:hypothetical protein